MTEAPAFHLGCGGRLAFSVDFNGMACEMCDRCGYASVCVRRAPTDDDNAGKKNHHGQGMQPRRGPGRDFPFVKRGRPPKEPT